MTIKEKKQQLLCSQLISKCCHDMATPLTGALLAFDSIDLPPCEKEISDITKKNLQKLTILLNLWRKIFGFSKSLTIDFSTLNDLKNLASTNGVVVTLSLTYESMEKKQPLLKALSILLYILVGHSCPGESIEIKKEKNEIILLAKSIAFIESKEKASSPLSLFFYQFLEDSNINFSTDSTTFCSLFTSNI